MSDLEAENARLNALLSAMAEAAKSVIDLCRSRVAELEAERALWKERFEDERRDHEATIKHCDRAMNEGPA